MVNFPYSDHDIVVFTCKIDSLSNSKSSKWSRRLIEKLLMKLSFEFNKIAFQSLKSIENLNNRWFYAKKLIIQIVDEFALLKILKQKRLINLPWYDIDLIKAERKCI